MYKSVRFYFVGLLTFLLLTNCSKESIDSNTLIVATSADNPPYEFIDKGQISGFDIDAIEAIAKKINKKVVIKNLDFPSLFAALASKNVDLVIAGLSVTPARQANVDFSNIYNTTIVSMLFRQEDSSADLLTNKIIGAQLGSTWEQTAKDLSIKHNAKVHSLANNLMLVEELKSKAIDVVILEQAQAEKFIENNPELSRIDLEDANSEFAIALAPGNPLLAEINKAIESLEADGTLAILKKKWFP